MRVDISVQRIRGGTRHTAHGTRTVRSGQLHHAGRDAMSQMTNTDPPSRRHAGRGQRVTNRAARNNHTGLHRLGQQFALLALALGAAYLIWRSVWSWRAAGTSVAWWLAVPALAVEVTGFLCVTALIWALWHRPDASTQLDDRASAQHPRLDYDVAIVATGKTVEELRATLVSLQLDPDTPDAIVIDHDGRAEFVHLASEFDATFRVAEPSDPSGLQAAVGASEHEFFLLLHAGDIPTVGAVRTLQTSLTDDSVAVVQGVVGATPGDSAEHGPNGRHDLTFERAGLNPGLGARGTGILTGSGALIRRAALSDIELAQGSRHSALWELMPILAVKGARVVASGGHPVVAEKPLTSAAAVADDRRAQADAGWRLICGPNGAFRAKGLRWTDRFALAAWSVRSLDGFRRIALGAVVLGALLAGRAPLAVSTTMIAYVWAPAFVLAAVALALLSGGALRPGDRLRGSVRAVSLSIGLVVAINAVLVIRGISDRFTHALRPLDHNTQIGLSAISLWLLAGSLDSLRLLARRRQNRRAIRLAASGTGRLDELGVYVSDVTMLGAGLVSDSPVRIGETHQLSFAMPSESGVTSIQVPCIVRNVRPDQLGAWRIGVEFHEADAYALNTLAECCAVLPAHAALAGARPTPGQFDEPETSSLGPRRLALQLATLLALAGVVSSTAPINAEASPPSTRIVSGEIVDSGEALVAPLPTSTSFAVTADTVPARPSPIDTTPNPVATDSAPHESTTPTDPLVSDPTASGVPPAPEAVGNVDLGGITVIGVCSSDAGADGVFGTSDDNYGATVSTVTTAQGSYSLVLDGLACWVSIEPPLSVMEQSSTIAGPSVGHATLVSFSGTGTVKMEPLHITRSPLADGNPSTNLVPTSATAAIGDRVWADDNADGIQQSDEIGVANASVTLYNAAGNTLATLTTGDDGRFLFDRLTAGRYSLGVSNLPPGMRVPGTDPLTSRTPIVSVVAGQNMSAMDVGVVPRSSTLRPSSAVILPTPANNELNLPGGSGSNQLPTLLIIVMAAFLAGSVVFASTQPIRGRRPTSQ